MHQILFAFFQSGITPEREIIRTREKTCINYFSMRNLYMKFQNPSMHVSLTNGRMDARTDGQPETNMLPQLLQSWGHKMVENSLDKLCRTRCIEFSICNHAHKGRQDDLLTRIFGYVPTSNKGTIRTGWYHPGCHFIFHGFLLHHSLFFRAGNRLGPANRLHCHFSNRLYVL